MGYTAFSRMEDFLGEKYGVHGFPKEPELSDSVKNGNDMESAALRFLHKTCKGLRFSSSKEAEETDARTKGNLRYLGRSLKENQIPYNMEMDIDRLCLAKSLEVFFASGSAEDAYNVYYCYIVMFLGRFSQFKRIVEFLSEYESNGSKLLVKHRDHFSHSVFVFALGLAIYETNDQFQQTFDNHYHTIFEAANIPAEHFFLKYWGLTSLFHDIGYPFELPFEQVLSYYEEYDVHRRDFNDRGRNSIYFSYQAVDTITAFENAERNHFKQVYNESFNNAEDLLAFAITEKLGSSYGFTKDKIYWDIHNKPIQPDKYNYFMDHAYFSTVKLFKELRKTHLRDMGRAEVDSLTAILLHNSLLKFSIVHYKDNKQRKQPLQAAVHPLAYLLMLCDELQCWNRHAYGRNTRTELLPMDAKIDFSNHTITAEYYYDEDEKDKIARYQKDYTNYQNGLISQMPRLKAFSDMAEPNPRFSLDIGYVVDLSSFPLIVKTKLKQRDNRNRHCYLSESSFLHLFDFAVILHGRRYLDKDPQLLEKELEDLSLEYQLSHLNRAKGYAKYLDSIHCFYTDRDVSYDIVREFTDDQVSRIAALEHVRWVREHQTMCWCPGSTYEQLAEDRYPEVPDAAKLLREQMRQHKLAMDDKATDEEIEQHFYGLDKANQLKDKGPMNLMLELLKKYDGLRIYTLGY